MRRPVLILFLLVVAVSQDNLIALSSCLGNCAICSPDEPAACSGEQYMQCIKGYNGTGCPVKSTLANEVIAMDSSSPKPGAHAWLDQKTTKCVYKNSKLESVPVYVLGQYSGFDENHISIDVKPYYHHFLLSFSLVRGVWTPFTDLLRVAVLDQDDNILSEHFIQFLRRDDINPKKNALRCNNQPRLIEKYQIYRQIAVSTQTKLLIKFEGMMFSEAVWALTDVKLAFGCSNFLLYNGIQCKTCAEGYYGVRNILQDVVSCNLCPLYCTSCSSHQVCQTCEDGFVLSKGKCSNKYSISNFYAPTRITSCPSHKFQLSTTTNNQEILDITFGPISSHNKIRVTFVVAYTSNALQKSHNLQISIDGIGQKSIDWQILKDSQERPKQVCKGFGKEGYYQLFKFVPPYIEHNKTDVRIQIHGDQGIKIGIEEVQVQYDEAIQPVPEPKILPNPQITVPPKDQKLLPVQKNEVPIIQKPLIKDTEEPLKQESIGEDKQDTQVVEKDNEEITKQPIQQPNTKNKQQIPSQQNLRKTESDENKVETKTSVKNQQDKLTSTEPQVTGKIDENNNNYEQSNQFEVIEQQLNEDKSTGVVAVPQITRVNPHIHKPSQIAKSMQKLQKNKWNIKTGIKTGRNLIISLYYPIQIEHFPYFVGKLQKKNISVVPRVIDKNNQEQQLHFDIKYSLLEENIDLFMAEKPPKIRKNTRILQQNNILLSTVRIERFDYLSSDEWRTIDRFSTFFEVLAWAIISSTIILCFLGKSVITQKLSLLLQIIFLHTFILYEYLPINLKASIQGLHRMVNLNYFRVSTSESIQKWLLGNVIQASPTKYTIFNKDINFTRLVYPCIIINLVYLVWFICLKVIKSRIQMKDNSITSNSVRGLKIKLYLIHLAERGMNFWCQIWQYQYIVFAWAACVQFYNLAYPIDADRSQTPNTIFCILCFILVIAIPIFTTILTRRAYDKLDYMQYYYQFRNIFFLQLPNQTLPTKHHNVHIIIRNARYLLIVLFIAYVGDFPIQCLTCIAIVHLAYLLYINIIKLQTKPICLLLHLMELIFFIGLALGMLVAVCLSRTLQTKQYMVIGSVLVVLCLLLCMVGLAQVAYYVYNQLKGGITSKERYSVSQQGEEGE